MLALEGTALPGLRGLVMRRFLPLLFLLTLMTPAHARQRGASITAIAPTFGAPGTTVSIRGAGFSGFETGSTWVKELASEPPPGAVEFNGVPGDVLFWQDDLITVKVPAGASTGAVRIVLPTARLAIAAGEFEVKYSTPGEARAKPIELAPETLRSADDSIRSETRERRFYNEDHVEPAFPFYANPWFSSLSPGERTFLGEQGFTNTFLFGNPFSHGRRQPSFFRDGFISGQSGFARPGFDRFGFQELFFRGSSFRGSRNTSIRPFWFFRFR